MTTQHMIPKSPYL